MFVQSEAAIAAFWDQQALYVYCGHIQLVSEVEKNRYHIVSDQFEFEVWWTGNEWTTNAPRYKISSGFALYAYPSGVKVRAQEFKDLQEILDEMYNNS